MEHRVRVYPALVNNLFLLGEALLVMLPLVLAYFVFLQQERASSAKNVAAAAWLSYRIRARMPMKEILVSTESGRSIMKKLIRFVLLCTLVALPATSQDKNAQIKTEVMTILDEFIAAFNKMDMAAWGRNMHFPH